jgi:hypothetical protein
MTASLTLNRFTRNVPAPTAHLVACCPVDAADALGGQCQVPVATEGLGRPAATGTPARLFGRAGADEFEIKVTLRVDGAHIEEVVAHSFANPHCVDVQVQRPTVAQRRAEEGMGLQTDDQASRRARSNERARSEAQADPLATAPLGNEWDEA